MKPIKVLYSAIRGTLGNASGATYPIMHELSVHIVIERVYNRTVALLYIATQPMGA